MPERITDFATVHSPYDEWTVREQASRCIQCPQPVCVTACPLRAPIGDVLELTANGRFLQAADLLFSNHGMPELFVHVCAGERLCEAACVLGGRSEAVPIVSIERFLLDYAWAHGMAEAPRGAPTGQTVAIVGAGLCGLVCADELSRSGHSVTVFDSFPKPGGRLINGLPGFRVDRALIEKRVHLLEQRGVKFRTSVVCGTDVSLASLRAEFDVVLFALGRADPTPLELPGAQLNGVHQAYPFVLQNTPDAALQLPRIEISGRRVAVLGGGDTAVDAARIAIRRGATGVVCIYRRQAADMPCSPQSYAHAVEEGVEFIFEKAAVAVRGNAAGDVTNVRCCRVLQGDLGADGRRSIALLVGSETDIACDVLLVAHGFAPPTLHHCEELNKLARDSRGNLAVDEGQMTSLDGVFAAGSIVRGSIPLVEVVRDARPATVAIDRYLGARRSASGANS